jgi:hypothetical protein
MDSSIESSNNGKLHGTYGLEGANVLRSELAQLGWKQFAWLSVLLTS